MIKTLLLISCIGIPISSESLVPKTEHKNPIYEQIIKNNPKLDKNYAMTLSNIIYHTSKKYGINPQKYAAILAQESMYRLGAKNCRTGICKDFGISQINYITAISYDFCLTKLTTDLHYSVEAGAKVLADIKKRYGHKEQDWWTRYNSSNVNKRKVYADLVMRFL